MVDGNAHNKEERSVVINPIHNEEGLIKSVEVGCSGVTARIALEEPLAPETDIERACSHLLKGARVTNLGQRLVRNVSPETLKIYGYKPASGDTAGMVVKEDILGQARAAFAELSIRKLMRFCRDEALRLDRAFPDRSGHRVLMLRAA